MALIIGLTGGIGSGKSTIGFLFEQLGVPVIDADHVARDLVQPDAPALALIRSAFGPEICLADGSLNRRMLRELIFSDAFLRSKLEEILHPRIYQVIHDQCLQITAPYAIVMMPLLFEVSRFRSLVDRTLLVDVSEEVQQQRITVRDQITPEQAHQAIHIQMSREQRLQLADDVIDNSATLESAKQHVTRLHQTYLTLAQSL